MFSHGAFLLSSKNKGGGGRGEVEYKMKGSLDLNIQCGIINSALPGAETWAYCCCLAEEQCTDLRYSPDHQLQLLWSLWELPILLDKAGTASEMKTWLRWYRSWRGNCSGTKFCGVKISHLHLGGLPWRFSDLHSFLYMLGGSMLKIDASHDFNSYFLFWSQS